MLSDAALILVLYAILDLMGYSVTLIGLLLVLISVIAAGVRAIVKGGEYSIFAIPTALVEALALLALFAMPTGTIPVSNVKISGIIYMVIAASIMVYVVYAIIDDSLSSLGAP